MNQIKAIKQPDFGLKSQANNVHYTMLSIPEEKTFQRDQYIDWKLRTIMAPGQRLSTDQFLQDQNIFSPRNQSLRLNGTDLGQQGRGFGRCDVYSIARPSDIEQPFDSDELKRGSKFGRTKRNTFQLIERDDVDPPLDNDFFKKNRASIFSFIDMRRQLNR